MAKAETAPHSRRRDRRSTVDLRSSILAWEIDPRVRRATGAISAEELEALVREERTLLEYVETLEAHARRLKPELDGRARPKRRAALSSLDAADTTVDDDPESRVETRVDATARPAAIEPADERRVPQTDELTVNDARAMARAVAELTPGGHAAAAESSGNPTPTLEPSGFTAAEIPAGQAHRFAPHAVQAWELEKQGARRRASARRDRGRVGRPQAEPAHTARVTLPLLPRSGRNDWYQRVMISTHELCRHGTARAKLSWRGLWVRVHRALGRAHRVLRAERAHPTIELPLLWYQRPSTLALMGLGAVMLSSALAWLA